VQLFGFEEGSDGDELFDIDEELTRAVFGLIKIVLGMRIRAFGIVMIGLKARPGTSPEATGS
jgi:hypothetical protein